MGQAEQRHGERPPFTQVPNAILEALMTTHFAPSEARIILTVLRYTYGFHCETAHLSLTRFERLTGLRQGPISERLGELVRRRVLIRTGSNHKRCYTVNPAVEEWAANGEQKTSAKPEGQARATPSEKPEDMPSKNAEGLPSEKAETIKEIHSKQTSVKESVSLRSTPDEEGHEVQKLEAAWARLRPGRDPWYRDEQRCQEGRRELAQYIATLGVDWLVADMERQSAVAANPPGGMTYFFPAWRSAAAAEREEDAARHGEYGDLANAKRMRENQVAREESRKRRPSFRHTVREADGTEREEDLNKLADAIVSTYPGEVDELPALHQLSMTLVSMGSVLWRGRESFVNRPREAAEWLLERVRLYADSLADQGDLAPAVPNLVEWLRQERFSRPAAEDNPVKVLQEKWAGAQELRRELGKSLHSTADPWHGCGEEQRVNCQREIAAIASQVPVTNLVRALIEHVVFGNGEIHSLADVVGLWRDAPRERERFLQWTTDWRKRASNRGLGTETAPGIERRVP